MMSDAENLIRKIQALPAEWLGEVEDFVDFLNSKRVRAAAWDRLLAVAPALEAAGIAPMTEAHMQAELDEVHAEMNGALAARS